MSGRAPSPGFTLVELMVTIAVLATLATIATPMFGDLIQKNRIDAAGAELTHLLQYARSEAITRGNAVTVSTGDGNWLGALSVATSSETLRRYGSEGINGSSGVSASGTSASLTFAPSGTLSGKTTSLTVTLCPSTGNTSGRTLHVYGSGQISSSSAACSS